MFVQSVYAVVMIMNAIVWFMCVAMFFANQRVRACFLQFGHWLERATGAILIALGFKIAVSD